MSESKGTGGWTPGPWRISRYARTHVVGPDERGICSTGGYETNRVEPDVLDAENRANADLIARAPEMDALLRKIRRALADQPDWRPDLVLAIDAALKEG